MTDGGTTRRAPARPAAVLWDMDGTLVDTEPYWIECEYALVADHDGRWDQDKAHAIVGMDLRDAAAYIAEHGGVDLPIDDIVNHLLDGVVERVKVRVPWRPGARELLRDLRRNGVPCALVTMSWRRFADAVVDALPKGSFDLVITGDEVDHGKPHPEPYLTAAARLGVEPKDCIALEDSPTGVRSAVAAGCTVYAIPNVVDIPPGPGYTVIPSLTGLDADSLGAAAATAKRKRRVLVGGTLAFLLAAGGAAVVVNRSQTADAPPPPVIPIDGWAPYWALDVSTPSVKAHGALLRDVSPFWYSATGDTTITVPPTVTPEATTAFIDAARHAGAHVVPSIVDGMPKGAMAALLADPTRRAAHVQAIVQLVDSEDFDGIDLDYESFAFVDGQSTWATTRPNWVAFVTELAAALHAKGKTITVSAPYIYDDGRNGDSGFWVYDYRAMGEVVDRIRIMAYDYSTSEPGPVAPLAFVQRAVDGAKSAVKDHSKLVLGVALYGYNWPISTQGTCPTDSDSGRTTISQATIADLLSRRTATPVHDAVTGESSFTYDVTFQDATTSCTQTREVHYVDAEGSKQRVDLARRERLGGAALWALGFDADATWTAIGSLAEPDPTATTATGASTNPPTTLAE